MESTRLILHCTLAFVALKTVCADSESMQIPVTVGAEGVLWCGKGQGFARGVEVKIVQMLRNEHGCKYIPMSWPNDIFIAHNLLRILRTQIAAKETPLPCDIS